MCHYVTAVLPTRVPSEAAHAVAAKHHLQFDPIANRFVRQQLARSEGYFRVGRGMCDCGTPLGNRDLASVDDTLRQAAKLRKRGWGETKIERWIEQQRQNRIRAERDRASRESIDGPGLRTWLSFLHAVLRDPGVSSIGLLLHWYSGTLVDERLEIRSREAMVVEDLTEDMLTGIHEDVLYVFSLRRTSRAEGR